MVESLQHLFTYVNLYFISFTVSVRILTLHCIITFLKQVLC